MYNETKPFWKTSEFYVLLVGSIAIVVDAIPMPERYEGLAAALIAATYMLSRGIAKNGVPYDPTDPKKVDGERADAEALEGEPVDEGTPGGTSRRGPRDSGA